MTGIYELTSEDEELAKAAIRKVNPERLGALVEKPFIDNLIESSRKYYEANLPRYVQEHHGKRVVLIRIDEHNRLNEHFYDELSQARQLVESYKPTGDFIFAFRIPLELKQERELLNN